jgi:hypothetical protein
VSTYLGMSTCTSSPKRRYSSTAEPSAGDPSDLTRASKRLWRNRGRGSGRVPDGRIEPWLGADCFLVDLFGPSNSHLALTRLATTAAPFHTTATTILPAPPLTDCTACTLPLPSFCAMSDVCRLPSSRLNMHAGLPARAKPDHVGHPAPSIYVIQEYGIMPCWPADCASCTIRIRDCMLITK